MDITTDVILSGNDWDYVIDDFKGKFFETQWQIFVLCAAIGIKDDKVITQKSNSKESRNYIPRTVLLRPDNNNLLDLMFQSAILTSKQISLDENKRLELAFDENETTEKFNKIGFIVEFANYGVKKIRECISESNNDIETMSLLKDYLENSYISLNNGTSLIGSEEDYELSD